MSASREIIGMIDHAVLAPDAGRGDVLAACALAVELGVAGVCVLPWWVEVAAQALAGSGVACGTVVGFPLGANITAVKVVEAVNAFQAGAQEIDMVPAITALKSGDYDAVREDIETVVDTASVSPADFPLVVKVILEMCYLTDDEKRIAAELAVEAGAHFLKTSTGLGPHGATVEDVALLRSIAPAHIGVKAAGGIRTLAQAQAMVAAGATRIGTSSTQAIAEELGIG
jgi:deoxyribose-phosphate aldolase